MVAITHMMRMYENTHLFFLSHNSWKLLIVHLHMQNALQGNIWVTDGDMIPMGNTCPKGDYVHVPPILSLFPCGVPSLFPIIQVCDAPHYLMAVHYIHCLIQLSCIKNKFPAQFHPLNVQKWSYKNKIK